MGKQRGNHRPAEEEGSRQATGVGTGLVPLNWNPAAELLVAVGLEPSTAGGGDAVRLFATVRKSNAGPSKDAIDRVLDLAALSMTSRLARVGAVENQTGGRGADLDMRYLCESVNSAAIVAEDLLFDLAGPHGRVWRTEGERLIGSRASVAPVTWDLLGEVLLATTKDGETLLDTIEMTRDAVFSRAETIPAWARRWPGETADAFGRTLAVDLSREIGDSNEPMLWVFKRRANAATFVFFVNDANQAATSSALKRVCGSAPA